MNFLYSLLALAFTPLAHAYEPEELLSKSLSPISEIQAPGQRQFLNPFTKVSASVTRLDLRNSSEHEISLNLVPKGISEAVNYKLFSKSIAVDTEVSRKLNRSQILQTAYTALISAALAKEQNASSRELKELMEKSLKLSSIEARRDRADVKNVLKATAELQKSINEMINCEAQIAGIKAFLLQHGLKLEDLNTTDLLSADDIIPLAENSNPGKVALTYQKILSESDLAKFDAQHSIAQRGKIFDGIKLSARRERKEDSMRLELSFNLPFLAAQDLNDYKDSLKVAETEVNAQKAMLEESQRSAGLAEVLRQKISLYRTMGSLPSMDSKALMRQDPALALDLQRTSVALRLTKAALLAEIRTLYVSLLLENETLANLPEINHLSRTKRKI